MSRGYRSWRNKTCTKDTNTSNEKALGIAFEVESHPFKVKSTPVTKKMVLEINSHPVKVTKNVIGKEVTCRLDLGGALGGQLPKRCRECHLPAGPRTLE